MKMAYSKKVKTMGLIGLLLGMIFVISACGSGGTSDGVSGSGTLFITDNLNDDYNQVIVTLYKVELERSADQARVTVFDDPQGITYDVHELDGILKRLPNASIPTDSYNRVLITLGQEIILVDKTGTVPNPNPLLAQNGWTICNNSQCVIDISGQLDVSEGQRVGLDFDLKQFTYDPSTNSVTAWIVSDHDGSGHTDYVEEKEDHFDLKGVVQSVQNGQFDLTVLKAEHFSLGTNLITVAVNNQTAYTCDEDDDLGTCKIVAFSNLQPGMRVEVYGNWDGSMFQATRVEGDHDMDIIAFCQQEGRSMADFSGFTLKKELEGSFSYQVNQADSVIEVQGQHILLANETQIKTESGDIEKRICSDQIPATAQKIDLEFFEAKDGMGNRVLIAKKVEFKV